VNKTGVEVFADELDRDVGDFAIIGEVELQLLNRGLST
jgi:hypothetical protein